MLSNVYHWVFGLSFRQIRKSMKTMSRMKTENNETIGVMQRVDTNRQNVKKRWKLIEMIIKSNSTAIRQPFFDGNQFIQNSWIAGKTEILLKLIRSLIWNWSQYAVISGLSTIYRFSCLWIWKFYDVFHRKAVNTWNFGRNESSFPLEWKELLQKNLDFCAKQWNECKFIYKHFIASESNSDAVLQRCIQWAEGTNGR